MRHHRVVGQCQGDVVAHNVRANAIDRETGDVLGRVKRDAYRHGIAFYAAIFSAHGVCKWVAKVISGAGAHLGFARYLDGFAGAGKAGHQRAAVDAIRQGEQDAVARHRAYYVGGQAGIGAFVEGEGGDVFGGAK